MSRQLTPEEARDPGVALAELLATAVSRTLTGEEVVHGLDLLSAVRLETIEDTYRRVGKVVDKVAKEQAA